MKYVPKGQGDKNGGQKQKPEESKQPQPRGRGNQQNVYRKKEAVEDKPV